MGRLERKLGSMVRPNLLKDVHPLDRLRAWLGAAKDRLTATADIADFVRLENENQSIKKEMDKLKTIVRDMNLNIEEDGTIHLTRRPGAPPPAMSPASAPDSMKGLMAENLPNSVRERVLQADLDATRRRLLAMTGQLNNVVELCRQTLETRPFISNPEAQALVIDIMTVAKPDDPRFRAKPRPGVHRIENRWPENEPEFDSIETPR